MRQPFNPVLYPDTDGLRLSAADAKAVIAGHRGKVHSFTSCHGWLGAEVSLDHVHAAIDQHGAHIADLAAHLGHRISVTLNERITYIETDEAAFLALLAKLDLLP